MKKFLSINFKDGKLFEVSKEEKEGWEKYESSTGKVSYRFYHLKGVTGVFQGIKLRKWEYGDEIQAIFSDGDTDQVVAFKLYTAKGNVDDTYLLPFLQVLPNMKVGETYTVFPYNFTPDGEKYSKRGVSVKQNGERVERAISLTYTPKDKKTVKGDIPELVWKEDKLTGKNKPSAASLEARDEVIKEYLSTELERLEPAGTSNDSAPTGKPEAKEEPKAEKPAEKAEPKQETKKATKKDLPF